MSKRDEYVEKMKSQLDSWNAELTKWEAKAKETQTEMRPEFEKRLAALYRLRDQGIEQIKQVQSAAGDAWMDLAHGTDEAWAKMREALQKAHSHFKK